MDRVGRRSGAGGHAQLIVAEAWAAAVVRWADFWSDDLYWRGRWQDLRRAGGGV